MLWQLWDWVVHRSASKPVLRAVCSNYTLLTILLAAFNMKNSWVMIFNRWQWWSLNFSFMICEKLYESQTATCYFVGVLSWSSIWNLPWSVLVLALQSNLDFQTKWDLKIILAGCRNIGLSYPSKFSHNSNEGSWRDWLYFKWFSNSLLHVITHGTPC